MKGSSRVFFCQRRLLRSDGLVAGAYAHARQEVARSLAGVAIAVALVPPLVVTGIGLGWLNWGVFNWGGR